MKFSECGAFRINTRVLKALLEAVREMAAAKSERQKGETISLAQRKR